MTKRKTPPVKTRAAKTRSDKTRSDKTRAAKTRGAKTRGAKTRGAKAAAGQKSTEAREPADEQTLEDQIAYRGLSLHDLFQQQTRQMLARADLNEEEKQNILIAMSCPCCGAGAMSYTVKLRR
jgi:hypothetical protein